VISYKDAGIDLAGADDHVAGISPIVVDTWTESVIGGFGGFAAGVEIPQGYRRPVLMMSADGVGTKLEVARRADRWTGVGFDLVAMCVDDLAAVGGAPLGFVDYLAVGALSPERDTEIVRSIAEACREAGCPLLGGETAVHPGVMDHDAVDLAGAAMGVVEKDAELGPHRVEIGDVIIGLRSPNLRSNGFSLVRSILGDQVTDHLDAVLAPSVIYSPEVLAAADTGAVRSAAHVTGGGIPGNLPRALPGHLGAEIDTSSWVVPDVFELISTAGARPDEMFRTFNMGIGFCLVVDPQAVSTVEAVVHQHQPLVIGTVTGQPGVRLT
jgi:phosphoribosylformylglycinamidine cyclo-ligase